MHEIKWIGEWPGFEEAVTQSTIRLGDRHSHLVRGDLLRLVHCEDAHKECGEECLVMAMGSVRAIWHGPLSSIPLKFAEREVCAAHHMYDGLKESLERTYGRDVQEREHITCVAFVLDKVFDTP